MLMKPRILTKSSDKCIYKICDGTGFIHKEYENRSDLMEICRCREYNRLLRQIKSAGIPADYMHKTIKDFQSEIYGTAINRRIARYVLHGVTSYLEQFNKFKEMGTGFYIHSQTKGSGKSLLSIIIGNELIRRYKMKAIYISTINMLGEIKGKMFTNNPEVSAYNQIESIKKAELLILDDLGAEKATEWSEETLTQILDDRMNYRGPTIISSNVTMEQLERKYTGGRINSRIAKMTFPLSLPEESVREKLAKQENDKMAEMLFHKKHV